VSSNPILSSGELGLETDTDKIKIGNGSTAWNSLAYFYDQSALSQSSASATYLNIISASSTYLSQANASATYLTKSSASATYLSQANASATYIPQISQQSIINSASAAAVTAVLDGAPGALNTLNELAAALNDDSSFATTVTNSLSNKLDISSASSTYLTQTSASAQYVSISAGGQEYIQDSIQGLFIHNNHTNINATYDDLNNKIIMTASAATFTGTTDDVTEGSTNLFFTNQRAVSAGSTTYALLGMASPSGGLAGQILSKSSSANYDTIWIDRETNIISPLLLMGA
jgi:hypothetical protein